MKDFIKWLIDDTAVTRLVYYLLVFATAIHTFALIISIIKEYS